LLRIRCPAAARQDVELLVGWPPNREIALRVVIEIGNNREIARQSPLLRDWRRAVQKDIPNSLRRTPHGDVSRPISVIIRGDRNIIRKTPRR
jgi:hypothetical protein